jgi:hypothetical protein
MQQQQQKHYIYAKGQRTRSHTPNKPTFTEREPNSTLTLSITQRHAFHTIDQSPPAIGLQLSVLNPLLRPVLMRPRDAPDHALEKQDLVAHALSDKDAARVLVDDRLLVLQKS